jgi:hypothetical protein
VHVEKACYSARQTQTERHEEEARGKKHSKGNVGGGGNRTTRLDKLIATESGHSISKSKWTVSNAANGVMSGAPATDGEDLPSLGLVCPNRPPLPFSFETTLKKESV